MLDIDLEWLLDQETMDNNILGMQICRLTLMQARRRLQEQQELSNAALVESYKKRGPPSEW